VKKNIFISLGTNGAIYFFQFLTTIVASRLLTPEQVGLFAVSLAVVGILQGLREFGVVSYLVQERNISDMKIRAVFAISIVVGCTIGALLLTCRNWIADFYDNQELVIILAILSVSFFTYPFGLPASAMLRRERKFFPLAVVATSSSGVSFVVTSTLCFLNHGPVSLAVGALAGSLVHTTVALFYWPQHLRLRPSFTGWHEISVFGAKSSLVSLIAKISQFCPELVIGKLTGVHAAALLTRGRVLTVLIDRFTTAPVQLAAVPEMAKQIREFQDVRQRMTQLTQTVCMVNWALLAFLSANSENVIVILYGHQWMEVPALLRILCLNQALLVLIAMAKIQYEAAGEVGRMLTYELMGVSFLIVGLVISCQWNLSAVCWSIVATSSLMVGVYWKRLRVELKLSVAQMLTPLAHPAAIATAVFVSQYILAMIWANLDFGVTLTTTLISMGANGLLLVLTVVLLLKLTNHRLYELIRDNCFRLIK
jgi:O-antigen/teichoic acid export membrane protein